MPFDVDHFSTVTAQLTQPRRRRILDTFVGNVPKFDLKNEMWLVEHSDKENRTVQSSEHEAMTLSLNGFHLMSLTGPP